MVWAKARPELKGYGPVDALLDLMALPVYETAIASVCRAVDERNARRTSKLVHSTELMEQLLFLQYAYGRKTMSGNSAAEQGLLTHLAHPEQSHERQLLGLLKGLPAPARFTQHFDRLAMTEVDRCAFWREVYLAARASELDLVPIEELLVLYMDSSHVETIYTCPIYAKDAKGNQIWELDENGELRKKVVNRDAVRCWEGGVLPKNSHDPYAQGFKLTLGWTGAGMCLGFVADAITEADATLGPRLIADVGPLVKERILQQSITPVIVMDGGFHTPYTLRNEIRSYGYIESCAETSAVNEAEARKQAEKRYPFENRPHFHTNGHREPNCECGNATVARDYERRDDGSVVARVEVRCPKGERFTITSGVYRLKENPYRWSKVDPSYILPDGTPEKGHVGRSGVTAPTGVGRG